MATGRSYFGKECSLFFYLFLIISFTNSFYINKLYSQNPDIFLNSKWYWTEPKPTGNMLYSVHFVNDKTGYASGSLGTIIKTTDSGESWNSLNSNTDLDLFEIFFINSTQGYAAGKAGLILKTIDGGSNWIKAKSGNYGDLHDIIFINKFTGYAAGLSGIILKTTDSGDKWRRLKTFSNAPLFCISFLNANEIVCGGYSSILKTSNAGLSWESQNINFNPFCAVTGISYIDSNTIYAAGNSPAGSFFKTTDKGSSWTNHNLNLPYVFGGSVDLVRSLTFADKNTGYIVTDFATILKTTNSGNSWLRDSSFRPAYEKLSVMYDINITESGSLNISGSGGTVFSSSDSGSSWSPKTGNKKLLNACSFIDSKTGFTVGEKGNVLKTIDGGINWINQNTFTNKFLNSISFFDDKTGYTAGDSGAIFKTTNSGDTWIEQTNYRKYNINCIYVLDELTGIVAGGNPENERAFIYRTDDGGASWYEVYDSLSLGVLNSVTFFNSYEGIAAGNNGNILKTFDAGSSWITENISSENLHSVSFANSINGLISGSNGLVYKTTNGGLEWQTVISGFFLNLTSVKLSDKNFALAAGEKGTIIKTYNGGLNWSSEKKITNNDLYSVNILDDSKLFAFGEHGTIIYSEINKSVLAAADIDTKESKDFILSQNFPNPFNPVTVINYSLPGNNEEVRNVKLTVHDILGKEITTLVNRDQQAGNYSVRFDASDNSGGIYFYSLYLNGKIAETKRMLVLK